MSNGARPACADLGQPLRQKELRRRTQVVTGSHRSQPMTMKEAAAMTEASGLAGHEADSTISSDAHTNELAHRLAEDLRRLTIEAPLRSLAIAFLLGMFLARRR